MSAFTTNDFIAIQQYFFSGATRSYKFRVSQLKTLKKAVQKYEDQIIEALYKDLHKSAAESFTTEIGFIYSEIGHTLKHLANWMETKKVSTPFVLFPSKSKIVRDSLGVTLIIAPWNYPFQLLIAPLIGAIAGGNCAVLKPSELTPNTSAVIALMIAEFFDKNFITVVEGDGAVVVPEMMEANRFDHIFFTGSIAVGKEIAKLAAQKLVSVTLELGGKSPCIVDKDVNIEVAAKRIVWGKYTNAGQTCVAPDYLLVHESRKDELITAMIKSIHSFMVMILINLKIMEELLTTKAFEKVAGFLQEGNIISGGKTIQDELYIAPTIIDNVSIDKPIMQEEIFGPVLPVFTFQDQQEVLTFIKHYPNPLSLYVFTNNKKMEDFYLDNISFGGGCVNNTLVHLSQCRIAFWRHRQ